jgi:hypothetical protein
MSTPTVSQLQTGTAEAPVSPEQAYDTLVAQVSSTPGIEFKAEYIGVKLFGDYVELDLGNNLKKCVSYPDFRQILGQVVTEQVKEEIPGILPPSNMIFFAITGKEIKLTCYYPSSIRPLQYHDQKMEIVTPNMLISHILKKDGKDWIVQSSTYLCTDNPVNKLPKTFINGIDHKNRIYLSALSNTYNEGRMCFGNNSMPVRFRDDNLRGLDYYYRFLWETPFNDDLGLYALSRGDHSVSSWYHSLEDLAKNNKSYPYERLQGYTKHPDGLVPAAPLR